MKKIIVLCIAFALVLGAFSGVLADDKVTLTFAETMTSPERTLVLQNAIEAFEAGSTTVSCMLWMISLPVGTEKMNWLMQLCSPVLPWAMRPTSSRSICMSRL